MLFILNSSLCLVYRFFEIQETDYCGSYLTFIQLILLIFLVFLLEKFLFLILILSLIFVLVFIFVLILFSFIYYLGKKGIKIDYWEEKEIYNKIIPEKKGIFVYSSFFYTGLRFERQFLEEFTKGFFFQEQNKNKNKILIFWLIFLFFSQ
jgi:hypothetical protein